MGPEQHQQQPLQGQGGYDPYGDGLGGGAAAAVGAGAGAGGQDVYDF